MNVTALLCSNCFNDQGLKLFSTKVGINNSEDCPNCGTTNGAKLDLNRVHFIAHKFFVIGSMHKSDYGAAPLIQYNDRRETDVIFEAGLNEDAELIANKLKIGFFHYGPRLWMLGDIEPLLDLKTKAKREIVFNRITKEYPSINLETNEIFYRIRKNPSDPNNPLQYDSPPISGGTRLDSHKLPVMYVSQDLEVCIHECRVTVEDILYLASLKPKRKLRLLDLSEILNENCTEFESLDLAVLMLFLAGKHSYGISQSLARYIEKLGYDGVIYPSYFSLVRTGGEPFPTIYGMSNRRIPEYRKAEKSKIIPNMALFHHPIKDGLVEVINLNRLMLNKVSYDFQFGPASFK